MQKLFKNVKNVKNEFYLKRYLKFINLNIDIKLEENFEVHHILPKSLYPEFEKEEWNLIKLSYRAHFIAHWMLAKALDDKM